MPAVALLYCPCFFSASHCAELLGAGVCLWIQQVPPLEIVDFQMSCEYVNEGVNAEMMLVGRELCNLYSNILITSVHKRSVSLSF